MQNVQNANTEAQTLEAKPDNLLGICQAAGEDLHINPFFLRISLTALLFFGPWLAVGAYAGLGLVVGVSRLLFPKPRTSKISQREPQLLAA